MSDDIFNFGDLLKNIQGDAGVNPNLNRMVQKIKEKFESDHIHVVGEALYGCVKVHLTQKGETVEVDKVELSPESFKELFTSLTEGINKEQQEMLEETLKAAFNDAVHKARQGMEEVRKKNLLSGKWFSEDKGN